MFKGKYISLNDYIRKKEIQNQQLKLLLQEIWERTEYCKQLYANKFSNLYKMEKFLERHRALKLNKE